MNTDLYLFIGHDRHIDDVYALYATEEAAIARAELWQSRYEGDRYEWEREDWGSVYRASAGDGYWVEIRRIRVES